MVLSSRVEEQSSCMFPVVERWVERGMEGICRGVLATEEQKTKGCHQGERLDHQPNRAAEALLLRHTHTHTLLMF